MKQKTDSVFVVLVIFLTGILISCGTQTPWGTGNALLATVAKTVAYTDLHVSEMISKSLNKAQQDVVKEAAQDKVIRLACLNQNIHSDLCSPEKSSQYYIGRYRELIKSVESAVYYLETTRDLIIIGDSILREWRNTKRLPVEFNAWCLDLTDSLQLTYEFIDDIGIDLNINTKSIINTIKQICVLGQKNEF